MPSFFVVVDAGTYSAEGVTFGPGRHECFNTSVRAAVESDGLGHVRIDEGGEEISTAEVEAAVAEKLSGTLTEADVPKETEFVCEECGRSYATSASLARHMTVAHTPEKSVEPAPVAPPRPAVEPTASAAPKGPGGPVGEAGAPVEG